MQTMHHIDHKNKNLISLYLILAIIESDGSDGIE